MAKTTTTTKADPRTSDGAQTERDAVRKHLQRELKQRGSIEAQTTDTDGYATALRDVLAWINARVKRYNKRPGGLGR